MWSAWAERTAWGRVWWAGQGVRGAEGRPNWKWGVGGQKGNGRAQSGLGWGQDFLARTSLWVLSWALTETAWEAPPVWCWISTSMPSISIFIGKNGSWGSLIGPGWWERRLSKFQRVASVAPCAHDLLWCFEKGSCVSVPIMESWGLLAFENPHLSLLSLGNPGDNWVLCAASKTQGPFSVTVPWEWLYLCRLQFSLGRGKEQVRPGAAFSELGIVPGLGDCGNIHSDTKLVTVEAVTMTTECNLRTELLSSSGGGCVQS